MIELFVYNQILKGSLSSSLYHSHVRATVATVAKERSCLVFRSRTSRCRRFFPPIKRQLRCASERYRLEDGLGMSWDGTGMERG